MAFIIDKQTLNDLKIFGTVRGSSIYGLFNTTRTRGGSDILEEMFRYPLSDVDKINRRVAIIRFFMDRKIRFDFHNDWFDTIEHYLSNTDERTLLHPAGDTFRRRLNSYIGADVEYRQIHKGVVTSIALVNAVRHFLRQLGSVEGDYREETENLRRILDNPAFSWIPDDLKVKKLTYKQTAQYDDILRYKGQEAFHKLLRLLYNMDVYAAIAQVTDRHHFVFAKALPPGDNILRIEDLRHPLLEEAVPNSIHMNAMHNVVFLTGANMAGKSTFMKSFGIVVYLAHMGFPVPVRQMEFSVRNGMYTTINLPDNMSLGYSHFYAEVKRLRKVAEQVSRTDNLIVVFDELFRGTNVKDAHEATVEVMKAFSRKQNCLFMISTHIIEAGEDLKKACDNIKYAYLPTVMQNGHPVYTYKLTEGITNDRHGMMIVNNEHIIDILKPKL